MYEQYLCNINQRVCKNSKLRDKTYLETISNFITTALNENDNIIQNAIKVAALIKLYQPFENGNHRTGLIVFSDILTQKGYTFDINQALQDMQNHKLNIPTIYEETDSISDSYIERYNKYILEKPKAL